MRAEKTQKSIYRLLQKIGDEGHFEWSVRTKATDAFLNQEIYAPRLDIAVGPFNATTEVDANNARIYAASEHPFIQSLIGVCNSQNGHFSQNPNPRCLLAIEVVFSGSSKHILGDFTNASMMGYVGLLIGSTDTIQKIKRIGNYARTLRAAGKAPGSLFMNTACMEAKEFIAMLRIKHA